jgi:DNA-directed RNA polymerase specialized sigma24 family protein
MRAAGEFYSLAIRLLEARPPGPSRSIPGDRRAALFHDIAVDCILNDFRVLRQYENHGKPFSSWLYLVARNKILDEIRERRWEIPSQFGVEDGTPADVAIGGILPTQPNEETRQAHREALEVVAVCMRKLRQHCQLLLRMTARGFSIAEILRVLRLPPEDNKRIADDRRFCRQQLRQLIERQGVDLTDLL